MFLEHSKKTTKDIIMGIKENYVSGLVRQPG